MKRSEMVVMMASFYNLKNVMVEGRYITPQEFCDQMLELVEELGMYPPDRFNKEGDCYTSEWDPK